MRQLFKAYWAKTWLRWTSIATAGLLLLLIVSNVIVGWYFSNHTYPLTYVGKTKVGVTNFANNQWLFETEKLLPARITLKADQSEHVYTPTELGVTVDQAMVIDQIKTHRSWLPIYNLLTSTHITLPLKSDSTTDAALAAIDDKTKTAPTEASIALSNGQFTITPAMPGSHIDSTLAKTEMLRELSQQQAVIRLPTIIVKPKLEEESLQANLSALQAQLLTSITLIYGAKKHVLTPTEIAGWYVADGNSYILSDAAMTTSIKQLASTDFAISVNNIKQVVNASRAAIAQNKASTIALTAVVARTAFYYCVAVRGVEASSLPTLEAKLNSVLNDTRGWGMGGKVTFTEVSKGCNLTYWLSAANQMTSFSSACDAAWSCTVSPNVIINADRWSNATDSWNATGRNLDDYRTMAINHETGHWLGFGHVGCGGPGQLAPIMEQQSIDLQGCVFNEWPLPSEQANLRAKLGI